MCGVDCDLLIGRTYTPLVKKTKKMNLPKAIPINIDKVLD
jgi:hypothetical protein